MPVRAQRIFLSLAFLYVVGGMLLSMTVDSRGLVTYVAAAVALLASFGCLAINHIRPVAIASYLVGTAIVGLCGMNFARIAIKWAEQAHWGQPAPIIAGCLGVLSLVAVASLWTAMPRTDLELADALARTLADENLDDDSVDAVLATGSVQAAGNRGWKYSSLATASLTIALIAVTFFAKTQFMPAGARADFNNRPAESSADSPIRTTISATASPDVLADINRLERDDLSAPAGPEAAPAATPIIEHQPTATHHADAPAADTPDVEPRDDDASEHPVPIDVPALDEASPPTPREESASARNAIPAPPRSLIRSRQK
ncbi:MAG: hypothetical protein KC983_07910 [Phycisphaerales bacterium]|nr:hypothetical protein [Phycisphaerales bacterium]